MPHLVAAARISLLLLIALAVGDGVDAANWPRFRGNNGAGVSADKQIPVSWEKPEDALLWKSPSIGSGHSCPIVWEGKVFLQGASDDGATRTIYCLDLNDGKVLWKQSINAIKARTHNLSSLASSTATTDGIRVYVPFWDGSTIAIYAYDMTGHEVWKRDLGPYNSQHGAGHSPIVHEGKVFFANDQDDKSFIVALRAENGEILWKRPREHRTRSASYVTPFLLPGKESPWELVVLSSIGFAAYDPDVGVDLWSSSQGYKMRTIGSPVVWEDLLIAGTGSGGGARNAIAFRLDRSKKPAVATVAWEENKSLPYVPSMLVHGDHLYYTNDRGVAGCCVAKTGETVWSKRLGTGADIYASPLLIDGRIYAFTKKGEVIVFAASPTFELLGQSQIAPDEDVMATPAVADGHLLIRGKQNLYCFGKRPSGDKTAKRSN